MMTTDFNKATVQMIGNRMIAIGEAPNVIANKACVGQGYLQELQIAHPCKIEVIYTFADSYGERFGAEFINDAPAPEAKTCLQRILRPLTKARGCMDFNDHFEVQTNSGSGEHRQVSIDYEVMNLVKEAVKDFSINESRATAEINNYWPVIKPAEFYLAKVEVKITKTTDPETNRDTPIIIVR